MPTRMTGYMMATPPPRGEELLDRDAHAAQDEQDLLTFAGFMLAIVGALNIVYGIAATSHSAFFDGHDAYLFGGLATWGWAWIVLGALQLAAVVSIVRRHLFGRVVGVATAAANAVLQMLSIAGHPFLSIVLLAIDVMVIYALTRHLGARPITPEPAGPR
ncbi:MAG TPA: hypothetical protein VGM33_08810 [Baekduia sp.]|jgi:hypothetical protein